LHLKLGRVKQEKAKRFIFEQARPLEISLYAFHFEGGSRDDVLDELARFQNPDGGFAHGFESDLRTPKSTTIATSLGFQILRETGADESCLLVQNGIRFLMQTYDAERKVWPIIVPEVNDHPHAPWWHFGEDRPSRWEEELANPRPEMLGYLHDYRELVPESILSSLTEDVISHLDKLPEAIEMHDLLCYSRLIQTKSLPENARARMLPRLKEAADLTVATDASQLAGYGLKPIVLAPSPDSVFARPLRDAIEANLDYEITSQGEDGAWAPNWSWPGDAWQTAEIEWKGVLTLRALLALKNYDRLELKP